jgi:hypothetical protein
MRSRVPDEASPLAGDDRDRAAGSGLRGYGRDDRPASDGAAARGPRPRGFTRACDLTSGRPGSRVRVAGSVIVRQRPGTPRALCSKPGGRPTLGRSCRKWPIRHPSTSPPMSGRPSPRFRSLRMGPRLRGSRDAAGRRAARGARPQACPLGIGTRGGRSRGAGSGSRLRLWMCDCGVKVRVASDDFRAECQRCGSAFTRAIPTGTPAAAEAAR